MRLGIAEILNKAAEQKTKAEKIAVLQQYDNPILRQILTYALDPNIKWALPEGNPPYKPCEFLDQHSRLYQEARRMYLFLEGGNSNLTALKRESLFIQFIESIEPEDAKVILAAKDKKLYPKGITPQLIKEAFPGLIPNEQDKVEA